MSTPNPLGDSHSTPPEEISSQTFCIAGILTTVYGLDEMPPSCGRVACLWLLHPRLLTKEAMSPVAASIIHAWNQRLQSSFPLSHSSSKSGLIAVAFDQRNHGSREVDSLANKAWIHGNASHAQDMFGVFHGTAMDVSLLMDHLGSYVFSTSDEAVIERHFVMGVSLGGHAAWQLAFNEPRIQAAVIIIGCPDYMRVMGDRARLSKLQSYTSSNGAAFLGSKDFPSALVASVKRWDPKGLLFGVGDIDPNPSAMEQARLREILDASIKGKLILVCSGGADKLVPYHASAPFMNFLKKATRGWYSDGNVYVEDNVYEGIGHAYSEKMSVDMIRFLCDVMEGKDGKSRDNASKI